MNVDSNRVFVLFSLAQGTFRFDCAIVKNTGRQYDIIMECKCKSWGHIKFDRSKRTINQILNFRRSNNMYLWCASRNCVVLIFQQFGNLVLDQLSFKKRFFLQTLGITYFLFQTKSKVFYFLLFYTLHVSLYIRYRNVMRFDSRERRRSNILVCDSLWLK